MTTAASVLAGAARFAVETGPAGAWLRGLPAGSVNCCVTSPPYYGLRAYLPAGHAGTAQEIGREETPAAFIARLVGVFDAVRGALADDGSLWVNIGDSYANDPKGPGSKKGSIDGAANHPAVRKGWRAAGLKKGDRIGIPHMLAFALRDAGWWWRDEVIWWKPNPLPKSVKNRTTDAHEMLFLFTKSRRYFWDHAGVQERAAWAGKPRGGSKNRASGQAGEALNGKRYDERNPRSVWRIVPDRKKYGGVKHKAVMPAELARRCVLVTSRVDDVILDPFAGSGTTIAVAVELNRRAIGCDLNPDYAALARTRVSFVTPNLTGV